MDTNAGTLKSAACWLSGFAAPPPAGKPHDPYWNISPYPDLLNQVVSARAAATRALYAATSDERSSSIDLTSTSLPKVLRLSTIVLVPAGRVSVPTTVRFHPAGAVKVLDD